jgi:hypothetical protein
VRFSENKDVDPNYSHKSGVTSLLQELLLTASLPDVAYVLHSHWADFHAPDGATVSPMVTAALRFFRERLPIFRSVVTAELPADGPAPPPVQGMAAVNDTAQCFVLWSSEPQALTADITLSLRPARIRDHQSPRSFDLLTLGPKQAGFFVPLSTRGCVLSRVGFPSAVVFRHRLDRLRSAVPSFRTHDTLLMYVFLQVLRVVALPEPPASRLKIPSVAFVEHGVVAGCIIDVASPPHLPASPRPHEKPALGADIPAPWKVTRSDVLVPRQCGRAGSSSATPQGMGHWDSFSRTLTLAVAGTPPSATPASPANGVAEPAADANPVAVAGVVIALLSKAAGHITATLTLHQNLGADPLAVRVGWRLDFLNGSQSLGSVGGATPSATSGGSKWATLWGGAAAPWPRGSSSLDCPTACGVLAWKRDNATAAAAATATFVVAPHQSAPQGWVSADGGARRMRLSLVLRGPLLALHTGLGPPLVGAGAATATSPITLQARLA